MKILIFEYSTGGGFIKQELPQPLVNEGEIMLSSLIEDLLAIKDIELLVPRDCRLPLHKFLNNDALTLINIAPEYDINNTLAGLVKQCDALWPIAPETDNALYHLSRLVEASEAKLLSSPAQMIKLAGDKMATCKHLKVHDIPVVATFMFEQFLALKQNYQSLIIKPINSAGCAGVRRLKSIHKQENNLDGYIVQPFVAGRTLSLSCIFYNGVGELICVNQQLIKQCDGQFKLMGCVVNISIDWQMYSTLVKQIASAMPTLWGYVGIDLIESAQGPLILELNPRLTTSYAGIRAALGVNVGACVIDSLSKKPNIVRLCSKQVSINITQI